MKRGTRRLLGVLAMTVFFLAYITVAMLVGATVMVDRHPVVQLVYFAVAGFAWTLPCMPIIRWMRRPDRADAV